MIPKSQMLEGFHNLMRTSDDSNNTKSNNNNDYIH